MTEPPSRGSDRRTQAPSGAGSPRAIRVSFQGIIGAAATYEAPAGAFHMTGECLRMADSRKVIARHIAHHWEVDGISYSACVCLDPCRICLLDASGAVVHEFGPFKVMRFADGVCYADSERLAELDEETGQWTFVEQGMRSREFLLCAP